MPLNRHRDQDGEEERKRNDTLVRTLRDEYGEELAPEFRSDMRLGTLKERLGLERITQRRPTPLRLKK